MKAIILAGGKGTRLAPYTTILPKPMLPLGSKPILEIIIRQLAYYGFDDIVVSTGYLSDLIKLYFKDQKNLPKGIVLSYVYESKPLGTAGPISLVPNLNETFLIMNGDVLTNLNFSKLFRLHKKMKNDLTIAMYEKKVKIDLGIIKTAQGSKVIDYIEKPTYTFNDSMGIYICEPKIAKFTKEGQHCDFPSLVKLSVKSHKRVYAFKSDSEYYWIDMGSYGDYQKAHAKFEEHPSEFLPE